MKRRASASGPPGPAKRNKTDRARLYRAPAQPAAGRPGYYTVARTRGSITQEMNYYDSTLIDAQMTSTTAWGATNTYDATFPAALSCLFCPVQGTAINNRVGRKVFVHRLRMKGLLFQPGGLISGAPGGVPGTSPQQIVRLILFCDKQTNAAQVGAATLMTSYGAATRSGVFVSFQNRDQVGRFDVYKDKMIAMPVPTITQYWDTVANAFSSYQEGVIKHFKFTVNFKTPLCVLFNGGTGGNIGDIVDNSFHLYGQCTSSAVATTAPPQLTYQCRTYFKE